MSPEAGPRHARRTPWQRLVSGPGARTPSARPARRAGSARPLSAPQEELQAARRRRHRSGPATRLRFLRPARFGSRLWLRLGSCRVSGSSSDLKRRGRALTSWALAPTRSGPGRDLAAPPARSGAGFQPRSDSSRAGVSPRPDSRSGFALGFAAGLGLVRAPSTGLAALISKRLFLTSVLGSASARTLASFVAFPGWDPAGVPGACFSLCSASLRLGPGFSLCGWGL